MNLNTGQNLKMFYNYFFLICSQTWAKGFGLMFYIYIGAFFELPILSNSSQGTTWMFCHELIHVG